MPLSFWQDAFATTTYLINKMPKTNLGFISFYKKFFGTPPNLEKLCIFGCLFHPQLNPYTIHKLDSHSKPRVFLGYSLSQSVYLCLALSSHKIITSRHVTFVEFVYPFLASHNCVFSSDYESCFNSTCQPSTTNNIPISLNLPFSSPIIYLPNHESKSNSNRSLHTNNILVLLDIS